MPKNKKKIHSNDSASSRVWTHSLSLSLTFDHLKNTFSFFQLLFFLSRQTLNTYYNLICWHTVRHPRDEWKRWNSDRISFYEIQIKREKSTQRIQRWAQRIHCLLCSRISLNRCQAKTKKSNGTSSAWSCSLVFVFCFKLSIDLFFFSPSKYWCVLFLDT